MKKKVGVLLAMLGACALGGVLTACGGGGVSIEKFDVQATAQGEIGISYFIPKVVATDSEGNKITASASVKDSAGKAVEVKDNMFTPTSMSDYTITYTVSYGNKKTVSKNMVLSVYDMTDPVIETELMHDIYAPEGGAVDFGGITVKDNSGEAITPVITAKSGERDVTIDNGVLNAEKGNEYVVTVSAKDSSDNTVSDTFTVHAVDVLTAENGVGINNEWYETEISDEYARTGEYSYKIDIFAKNVSWFADEGMFGEMGVVSAETYRYLSFWVYFDFESAGFNGVVNLKSSRYATALYDETGTEVPVRWPGDTMHELKDGHFYRFVVDMQSPLSDEYGPMANIRNYWAELGVWDLDINNNALSPVPAYFDDVKLVKESDLETTLAAEWGKSSKGKKLGARHEGNVISNYEIEEDLKPTTSCASSTRSTERVLEGTYSAKFTAYPDQAWVNINSFIPATAIAEGQTRMHLFVFVPTTADGTCSVTICHAKNYTYGGRIGIGNQVAYLAAGNVYTLQETITVKNGDGTADVQTSHIPTNRWVCLEFDIPEEGVEDIFLSLDGHSEVSCIYIDAISFGEKIAEPNAPVPETPQPSGLDSIDIAFEDEREKGEGASAAMEISAEQKHGGESSLKLTALGTNTWIETAGIFRSGVLGKDMDVKLWIYIVDAGREEAAVRLTINGVSIQTTSGNGWDGEAEGYYTCVKTGAWDYLAFTLAEGSNLADLKLLVPGFVDTTVQGSVYLDDVTGKPKATAEEETVVYGFESATEKGTTDSVKSVEISTEQKHSGESSLKITAYDGNNWIDAKGFMKSKVLEEETTLRLWIYIDDGAVELPVTVKLADGTVVPSAPETGMGWTQNDRSYLKPGDWRSITFTLAAGTDLGTLNLLVEVFAEAGGSVYLDDLETVK